MTYKEFIAKYQGKKLDYDGAYGAQCVDLFRYFCKEVLEISQPKGVAGAKDFWTNYPTDPNLYNNFDRITNTPDFVPQPGDVWIWTAQYGKYGHVAIESYAPATTSTFQCFSQNDPAGSPCVLKDYKYKNVYGVLRPKNQTNIKASGNMGGGESEDETKTLKFLDCKNFDEAESKLIEHLGIKGDKCAWGTDDGDGTGGFLGSERRKVKKLEIELNTANGEITRLNGEVDGISEEHNKIIDGLNGTIQSQKQSFDALANKYQALEGEHEKCLSQKDELQAKVQHQHKQIDVLDEKLIEKNKEIDALEKDKKQLQQELMTAKSQFNAEYVSSLERERGELKSQIAKLEKEIASLQDQLITQETATKKGIVARLLQLIGL